MSVFNRMIESEEKNKILPSTLYLIATPIGNLADLSARAYKTLAGVDFIAAEDTRSAQRLLSYFELPPKECVSYFEHNKKEKGSYILSRLLRGESCALITDAGTPAVSDPGEDIVRLCAENGVAVTAVPGACAAINALSLSALSTRKFVFEGFLSANAGERRRRLDTLRFEERTLIFYEAPHKLRATLSDLLAAFGNRRIALCREMTKLNEEIMRVTIEEAVRYYEENAPRGEYVLVIEGADPSLRPKAEEGSLFASLSCEEHVAHYEAQGLSRMDAIKAAARDLGISKSELYRKLHQE